MTYCDKTAYQQVMRYVLHPFLKDGFQLLQTLHIRWVDIIVLLSEQSDSEKYPFCLPFYHLTSSIKCGSLLVKILVMISDPNGFERQPSKNG